MNRNSVTFQRWMPVLLFLLALLVRLPKLQEIPGFGLNELHVTLALVRGEQFPLINAAPHIGALSNYIYALGFWVFGLHYWVPRVLTVIAGSATVVLLFYYARRTTNARTAFLAALLMVFSVYHVYFLSHVPWSNCLTPFFTMLLLLCFSRALEQQSGRMIVFSGFCFGLALQTHPFVMALLPALFCLFILQEKSLLVSWIKRPILYVAVLAAIVGYGNVLYYKLLPEAKPINLWHLRYAYVTHPGLPTYLADLKNETVLMFRLLAGEPETKNFWDYLRNPEFLLCVAGLFCGVVLCLKRHNNGPLLLFLWPMVVIPVFNHGYEFCKLGRYLGFLIPLACLITAIAAIEALDQAQRHFRNRSKVIFALWLIFPALYIGYHLLSLYKVYSVLQVTESALVSLKTHQLLQQYDRKNTSALISPQVHENRELQVFLESDGWNVEILRASARQLSKLHFADLNDQVGDLSAGGRRNIIALISSFDLKYFLRYPGSVSLEGCLTKEDPLETRDIYGMLLNDFFFVIRVVPPKSNAETDPRFQKLRKLSRHFPDYSAQRAQKYIHRGSTRKRSSKHVRKLEALLESTCLALPAVSLRDIPWKICEAQTTATAKPLAP